MGSQGTEDAQQGGGTGRQGSSWWTEQSHICMQISQEEQQGNETDQATQDSSTGN